MPQAHHPSSLACRTFSQNVTEKRRMKRAEATRAGQVPLAFLQPQHGAQSPEQEDAQEINE